MIGARYETQDVVAPSRPTAREAVTQSVVDGLDWTYRTSFAHRLSQIKAAAWSEPARQGWTQIKRNAARVVWRAEIEGKAYFLKYYFEDRLTQRLKRLVRGPACAEEFRTGVTALVADIAAVRPAGFCPRVQCERRRCSLLVTEALEPTYPLNEFWITLQSDERPARQRSDCTELTDRLARMIAQAHQAGFEHTDMHAANILVHVVAARQYRTAFVDIQNARLRRALSDNAVVRNLAQLNQWFRWHSSLTDRLRFLRRYLRWRDEFEHDGPYGRSLGLSFRELSRALIARAERHAGRLWAKRDRRAERNGRYFARVRVEGWRGLAFLSAKRATAGSRASTRVLDAAWWREQLHNPLRWFDERAGEVCKDSHSAQVARGTLEHAEGTLAVIAKRPIARNWRRRLRQLWPPSRSMRGWRMANALLNRDLATARPLAVLERRLGPLVFDQVLLTETVAGALDLPAYLVREFEARSPRNWLRHKRELTHVLAWHLRRFFARGFVHRDCKAENLLVVSDPDLKILWIDMDGIRQCRRPSL